MFEGESVACITEIRNSDTDVGKLEPCAVSVGMYDGAGPVDNRMEGPQKITM